MPLLLGCAAIYAPRLVLVLVWLFSDLLKSAYDSWFWPLCGFLFLPLTTLAYAWSVRDQGTVDGLYNVLLILAVMCDFGIIGHKAQRQRKTKEES